MSNNNKKGFTLIELLVVISIITLLSAVVLAALNNARMKGSVASSQVAKDQVRKALALYWTDNGTYPLVKEDLINGNYISVIDPAMSYVPFNYDSSGVVSSCTDTPCSDYFLQTWSTRVSLAWGPNIITGADSNKDGAGNTNLLAGLPDSYPAADYCANLEEDGYDNWYLPAKDELLAGWIDLNSGGFPSGFYWSSTESSSNGARALVTSNEKIGSYFKYNSLYVRCLR